MKKVILNENKKDKVYLKDLDNDNIVGILWEDKEKTTCIKFENSFFEVDNFQNTAKKLNEKDIQRYIKGSDSIIEVYVFDTMKELFKWLSE